MKYYIVDAFTDKLFKGNPAGVCVLDSPLADDLLQKIAFENNLAETAFVIKNGDHYNLRWFTPDVEIDLCGHATLATAYVISNHYDKQDSICFVTKSGELTVTRDGELFTMDFPSRPPVTADKLPRIEEALGCRVLETYKSRDYLAIVENEDTVRNLKVNIPLLASISSDVAFAVIVSARGESCDFVSRFYAPNAGIPEDPVTGSSHSTLIPFWSQRLNKTKMQARQLSPRGGVLYCEDKSDRVNISGKAVCYLKGEITL